MLHPSAKVLQKHISRLEEIIAANIVPTQGTRASLELEELIQDFWAFRTHVSFDAGPDFGQRATNIKRTLEPFFPATSLTALVDFAARQVLDRCKMEDERKQVIF